MPAKKKGLGRGLDALLGGSAIDQPATPPKRPAPKKSAARKSATDEAVQTLPDGSVLLALDPRTLDPNPKQPRKHFDEEHLQELAESIRESGLQEPVIVRPHNGGYQLVMGERRVRASILADLETVPAVCRDVEDDDMLMLGLIENIQREDLNPIETAEAYQGLIDAFGWSHEELAERVGKKRATVTNMLRLLQLPEDIHKHVVSGEISMGHARALLAVSSPSRQAEICRRILRDRISVREVEKLAQASSKKPGGGAHTARKDPHLGAVEDELRRKLATKVRITADNNYKGAISLEFYSLDDLDRLLDLLR